MNERGEKRFGKDALGASERMAENRNNSSRADKGLISVGFTFLVFLTSWFVTKDNQLMVGAATLSSGAAFGGLLFWKHGIEKTTARDKAIDSADNVIRFRRKK